MWRDHIDDVLTFSTTFKRCWLRYDILVAVQEAMHIKQSPKYIPECLRTHIHADLTWTDGKTRAPEAAKDCIRLACTQKPSNCRGFRKLCGTIKQCVTALAFTPLELTKFGELMSVMEEGVKKGKFTPAMGEALESIGNHVGDIDWYYMDADTVISDTRSALLLSEIFVFCIGMGLFSVAIADASTIKVEHLHDPNMCRLNSLSNKKFNTAQQAWHSAEQELCGGVENVKKHCNFQIRASMKYTYNGIPKIDVATDSRPALGKWKILRMPHLQHFDFLQIKWQRLLGWLEDVQVMKYWPVC